MFRQRRSVDLPEPEAPMRQMTSCSGTSSETWSRTCRSPNHFETLREPRERNRDQDEEDGGDEVRRKVPVLRRELLRERRGLGHADDVDDRGVLLQPDEVVEKRRNHPADGLRDDHVPHRLRIREPK
jgi:hypothetical protein